MNTPEFDLATLADAARLAGLDFSEAECRLMLEQVPAQVARVRTLRDHPLPNGLGPAASFDPRLPHHRFDLEDRPVVLASADVPGCPSDDERIAFAPLGWLSEWIRAGDLSSVRLTEIYLERIERLAPRLECMVTVTAELARAQAAQADAELAGGRWRGPLHGIAWGAKDLLDTADIGTTWGAAPYRDRVPREDAAVVERLSAAGAVLVAKTTLGALAYGDVWFGGRTRNPWNPLEGASGSSAGSGAAVAAGLVGFAIGTETMGSIVSPCMRCGTTGLRPTFGRVSRRGAMALCWSLDKIGPIARSVEDTALVLDAVNGYDPADPGSVDLPFNYDGTVPVEGVRLGYDPRWFDGQAADPPDRAALDAAASQGAQLVEIALPDLPYDALWTTLQVEAAAAFEALTVSGDDELLVRQDENAWPNLFRKAHLVPAVHLLQVERFRRQVMSAMDGVFESVEALIAPSFAAPLQLVTNMTGHPALTLRTGFVARPTRDAITAIGAVAPSAPQSGEEVHEVPHGTTLWGRLYEEGTLLRLGAAIERELDVWHRTPSL